EDLRHSGEGAEFRPAVDLSEGAPEPEAEDRFVGEGLRVALADYEAGQKKLLAELESLGVVEALRQRFALAEHVRHRAMTVVRELQGRTDDELQARASELDGSEERAAVAAQGRYSASAPPLSDVYLDKFMESSMRQRDQNGDMQTLEAVEANARERARHNLI